MSTEQRPPGSPSGAEWGSSNTANTVTTSDSGMSGGEWGAQQQRPQGKRSVKKIVIAVAVAIGIAGAGAGVVYAASGSTSDTAQGPGQGGMGGGPGGQGGGGGGQLMDALHGEYVVSDGNGTYTTELLQNGEVTAVSDTSITAKSDDGYTHTYTIDSDTVVGNGSADLSSIATGDDVTIIATESGDTATVDTLTEAGTATGQGQMGQAPPGQNGTANGSSGSSGN